MEKELKIYIKNCILVAMKVVTGVKNHVSINDNHKTLEWVFTHDFKEFEIKRTTVDSTTNVVEDQSFLIQKT